MKIIILGAGKIGGTLAENLVNENNDITVIDLNIELLRYLQDRFDLRVVQGHAAHPKILEDAGAKTADMVIAVTNSDEINMIACQIAYTLFNIEKRIARIHSNEYLYYSNQLFINNAIPINYLFSPTQLIIDSINKLIEYPGTLQVVNFCDNKLSLIAITAYYGGPLVGNAISTLKELLPYVETRIVAIFRHDRPIYPQASTIIEAGDEVFFIVSSANIRDVMQQLQHLEKEYKKIMIAGGGNIGAGLAKLIENRYRIKLIEFNAPRAQKLAERLNNALVFHGNATDDELLTEEHIDQTDLFIAVTDNDETNIMSSLLAKKLGAKKCIALIQQKVYLELMQSGAIDITLYPQQATMSAMLNKIRQADIVNEVSLRRGVAEAIELVVHGDHKTSLVVNRFIKDIKLPPGSVIGAIVRGEDIFITNSDIQIAQNDHVIMFLSDKKYVKEVERLFQPL